jgi:hypothetical protein
VCEAVISMLEMDFDDSSESDEKENVGITTNIGPVCESLSASKTKRACYDDASAKAWQRNMEIVPVVIPKRSSSFSNHCAYN